MKHSLNELGNTAKIFTFKGMDGDSEPVENLFIETKMDEIFM